jgi:hypothetical protein
MDKDTRHNPYRITLHVKKEFSGNAPNDDLPIQNYMGFRSSALSPELIVKILYSAGMPIEKFLENVLLKEPYDGLTKVECAECLLDADCDLKIDEFIAKVIRYDRG